MTSSDMTGFCKKSLTSFEKNPPKCSILDSGEVEVTQNAVIVATIGEWGTFGELALMHGQPRLATVTATSDKLKLWAIDRHTYRQQRYIYSSFDR